MTDSAPLRPWTVPSLSGQPGRVKAWREDRDCGWKPVIQGERDLVADVDGVAKEKRVGGKGSREKLRQRRGQVCQGGPGPPSCLRKR